MNRTIWIYGPTDYIAQIYTVSLLNRTSRLFSKLRKDLSIPESEIVLPVFPYNTDLKKVLDKAPVTVVAGSSRDLTNKRTQKLYDNTEAAYIRIKEPDYINLTVGKTVPPYREIRDLDHRYEKYLTEHFGSFIVC